MNTQTRRFIFIDFENLQQVKFRKLEKVATRIFIFTDAHNPTVPLALVQQMQRFGKNLKWIVIDNPEGGKLNYHMAFVMGKLHQRVGLDVEFAVVSNDADFDSLMVFINNSGRSCVRVKRKKEEPPAFDQPDLEFKMSTDHDFSFENYSNNATEIDVLVGEDNIGKAADDTVKRLIRSGNRPAEISNLKNYILLHNQELSLHGHVERIIQKMRDAKDIDILKGEIVYNF